MEWTDTHYTEKEREVMQLISAGMGNAQIAQNMGVSVNTVKSHLKHVYKKSGVHNRTELAVLMLRGKL